MTSNKSIVFLLCLFLLIIGSAHGMPNRIISLAPSQTELLYAIGLGDQIVGVSNYSNYPEDALNKPMVGDIDLNIEQILALNPTIIVDANSLRKNYTNLFKQLNLKYVDFKMTNLEDTIKVASELGNLLNEQNKAESFIKSWKREYSSIEAPNIKKNLTFYAEIWGEPMQGAGSKSFISILLEKAKIKNILESPLEYPVVNRETIVAFNPDIIFIIYPTNPSLVSQIKNRAAWNHIKAVKNNNVYILEQDLFVRPGPRNLEGLKQINQIINEIKQ